MNKNVRRLLGGMSTATLVLAGSIPLMAQKSDAGKQPKAVKQSPKSGVADNRGKTDCGKGACRSTAAKNAVKSKAEKSVEVKEKSTSGKSK